MPLRNRPAAVSGLIASLVLAGCAGLAAAPSSVSPLPSQELLGPLAADELEGLRTEPDVFYTEVTECGGEPCRVPLDVIAPADRATLPTVVLFNGGGKLFTERRYQTPLAVELAKRGAVVFLVAYRGVTTGNYDSQSFNDARCALRFARAHAADYGGDPDRVVAIGHSLGGLMSLDIAIHPEEEADGCLADGTAIPDGAIGLGSPRPTLTDLATSTPPLWLFGGSEDHIASTDADRLREAGLEVQAQLLPGITHDGITDPTAAPEIVDLIVEALESI